MTITTKNLAHARPSFASSSADTSGPNLCNDNNPGTFWLSDDVQEKGWVEVDLGSLTRFNTVAAIEPTYLKSYGSVSRIKSLRVEGFRDGGWRDILTPESGSGVYSISGAHAERVRLSIVASGIEPPGISEFGIYAQPGGIN